MVEYDKKIYDLCRRYQYFYKAYRDVKDVQMKYGYHSPQLGKAVIDIQNKLVQVKDELCVALLETNVRSVRDFKVSKDYPEFRPFFDRSGSLPLARTYSPRCVGSTIEIECTDDELAKILGKAIYGVHEWY